MPDRTSNSSRLHAALRASLRTLLAGALLAAAAPPAAAMVTILVESAGDYSGHGSTADNVGNEFPPNGAIHGLASARGDVSSAFVANGGAGPCDFIAGVPGCAYELPQTRAMGEIRGDLGRLRAAVLVMGDLSVGTGGIARVELGLGDVIQTTALGDLRFDLHFDVDNFIDGIESTLDENIFELHFALQPLVTGATAQTFDFILPELEGGHTTIDRSFAFAALPNATQVLMTLNILSSNECNGNSADPAGATCRIYTDAGCTAYIGVKGDYVSLGGFGYPGFAAVAPVPEPETAALFAAGLLALAALRRRRAQR